MKTIALTGKDGGKMAGCADIEIRVPHFGYAGSHPRDSH